MAWRVFGTFLETADLTTPNIAQKFRPISQNLMVDCARVWIIGYGDPTFTALTGSIYADRDDAPGKLIAASTNTILKADLFIDPVTGEPITPEDYFLKEVFFLFDKVPLRSTEWYHFAIQGTGYTAAENSALFWRRGWPDPVHRTNIVTSYTSASRAPHCLYFRGAEI
jgi:hypothetical protein